MTSSEPMRMILMGDMAVGKSHLLERFADGGWTDQITPGLTFVRRTLEVAGNDYTLQIFDAPGAPRMWVGHRESPYLRRITCVILVYDITNRESFEHVKMWLDEANSICPEGGTRIIVGTKADAEHKREVSWETAQRLSQDLGMPIIETSAWSVRNIANAFSLAVKCEIQRRKRQPPGPECCPLQQQCSLESGSGDADDGEDSTEESTEDAAQSSSLAS